MNKQSNTTTTSWVNDLAELMKDPAERERMNKAWQREIKKDQKKNPNSAHIDFMKAIRF